MKRYLMLIFTLYLLVGCAGEASSITDPPADASIGDTWTRPADGAVMVYLPAGEFLMGSAEDDPTADDDEKPQHTLYLDAFWIDKTEVTNAQYRQCVEAGACEEPGCWYIEEASAPDQPVVCVDWYDAQVYAEWVGGRLPTEAEWEKAARGTDGRLWPWGNEPPDKDLCNFLGDNVGQATPVGQYSPRGDSPYGCADMAGNVWEWLADWYGVDYYTSSPSRNPQGPESGDERVLRGGSFSDSQSSIRCAHRFRIDPDYWGRDQGFRVVVAPGSSGP